MKIELDKSFIKKLEKRVNRYRFEVGVLDDKPHFYPSSKGGTLLSTPDLKSYAGGPARKQTRDPSNKTVGEVLVDNMVRLGKNILLEPFKDKNAPLLKFMDRFLKMVIARKSPRRVENLLQAVVRNPILKQEYGQNSGKTAREKGFNRHLIDTSQMFKAIKARIKRV